MKIYYPEKLCEGMQRRAWGEKTVQDFATKTHILVVSKE